MLPTGSGAATPGVGSFCAATPTASVSWSTIGQEKARNPALTLSVDRFVAELLAGLDAYPAYYARMGPGNAAGPSAPDLSLPAQAGPAELRRRAEAGEWLVDLRSRRVFAAGHLAGSLGFELGDTLAAQLGWLLPAGTPVTLLGETAEQVAAAQRELARIGIDRPVAIATGKPEDWAGAEPLASYPVADFAALAEVRQARPVTVLDVRRDLEWAKGHMTVPSIRCKLTGRLGGIPGAQHGGELVWEKWRGRGAAGGAVWVHCRAATGGGGRVPAQAAGRAVTAIDDEFSRAAGRPAQSGSPRHAPGLAAGRSRAACCASTVPVGEAAHVQHKRVRRRRPPGRCRCRYRTRPPRPDPRGHQDRDPRHAPPPR
jgi:rhodanese-related sulfurtransferase